MAIPAGTRLGPHEVLSAIGAGGMGEVYRARDTRLDRLVAIKVLLPHMADRLDVRERFEREARTIAGLNHPHICVLHDIGQQDGVNYLVMEYLEGETLAQRLRKGPLPLDETLRYAAEIADALDKAHAKNITHRDLKPGNIMLTKSGTKLLDFGLAKLKKEAAPPAVPTSQLPTLTNLPTAVSSVVGTLQYMSPEQLEGKELDGRTDIFAFGAVVYEMATGKRAFQGATEASLISAIMTSTPPPISELQTMTPPALDRVVRKCLAKEPEKRWQTASDLSDELKWIAQGGSESAQAAVPARQPASATSKRWLTVTGLTALALAIVAGIGVWMRRPASPASAPPVSRFAINLTPGERLSAADYPQPAVAISPDGTRLVYAASRGGGAIRLFLRGIDNLDARAIAGTEGATNPFFSPDGQWIGFFAGNALKKVSITGGTPTMICNISSVSQPFGATWGADDTILFGSVFNTSLLQVPASGGTPKEATAPDSKNGEVSHRWPSFLPDAKALLHAVQTASGSRIVVRVSGTDQERVLIPSGERPVYAPTGHVIFNQEGTLMAAPFDLERLAVTGPPVAVQEGVMRCDGCGGGAQYSLSNNGTLVYVPGAPASVNLTLVWVSRDGREEPLAAPADQYRISRVSPDGKSLSVTTTSGLRIYDLARGTLTLLNSAGSNPAWSADGKHVAFVMNSQAAGPTVGSVNMFWQPADSSRAAERLGSSEHRQAPSSFSRDGQLLAFTENHPTTASDIWTLRLSDRKAEPFIQAPSDQGAPKFSPDGRWLAYASDESGRREVYVQRYPGPGGKWQISADGGSEPLWNPNGHELFYRNDDKVMAVEILTQPRFLAGKPRTLFEGRYRRAAGNLPYYDIAPDGRFLMLKPVDTPATQFNIVLNWFEVLKQEVPTGTK